LLAPAAAAAVLAAASSAPAPADDEEPAALAAGGSGPTVAEVEVRSAVPVPEKADLESLLDVVVGEPLTDIRIRRTLRNLQASGLASEVEIYSRPTGAADGSVAAVVVLRAAVQAATVDIAGQLGLPRADLTGELEQREGQPLAEDRVLRGVYKLQDLYRRSGYFEAKVHVAVHTDEARRRADVVYQVDSGPRASIGSISFEGPIAPFKPEELLKRLRSVPGKGYRQQTVRDDSDRLQQWLLGQHHNLARVDPPREAFDAATDKVAVTYPLDVGPRLEVQVVGAPEARLKKKDLLPFLGKEGYDDALVLQSVARIKDYFQQEGHYHAQVDSKEEKGEGILKLVVTITPGPVYKLTDIRFQGNQGVSGSTLAALMATSGKRLLSLGSGRLVQSELDKDLDNIRSYYALQGYAQAKVGPPQVDERGAELTLTIPVVEGHREQVGDLRFAGVQALSAKDLQPKLPLRAGGPFHTFLLDQALDGVRATYADKGYDQAAVSARTVWNPDHTRVDLTIEVVEGQRAIVNRIIVRGNEKTLSDVIRRSAGLERGQAISASRLLEVERSLYRLGIFSQVNVDLTRAGLGATGRDVVIRVQEGKSHSLTYGAGYDTQDGPRGLLGFTSSNIGGRAYSLVEDLRLSNRNKQARVIFNQPYLGRYPIPLTSTLFYTEEVEPQSFTVNRLGGRVEAVKTLGRTRFSLAADFREVRLRLKSGIALNDIERQNRPYRLVSGIPGILLDHRDDPVFSTRGWSTLAQVQYSFPAFGTQANFLKLFTQQTQYLNLGRAGVIAASGRLGGIQPFNRLGTGDPDTPTDLPSADIPIDERFFAGGSSSQRAYGLDLLGIRGQTLFLPTGKSTYAPVGGNGLLLFNLDYRFPIAGAFGGTVFYDAGNVWADWRSIRVQELKSGVGLGARWNSPIGPLRVEVGWKLHRDKGESATPVVFLSFGNPF
ncbi:MAG TPA: outer membrane protein assembly factor BamA, partial [Thermoanaerobaculia bacterium]|nr:outer membrane protein assembly factor BamA [Thermoanaerobaculia bacterium]